MTTNEASGPDDATPESETIPFAYRDAVLDSLVAAVEAMEEGEGEGAATITLYLGGGYVYGELIPYRTWIKAWLRMFREANEVVGGILERGFSTADPTHRLGTGFLHLRDATYRSGDAAAPTTPLWRGEINRIRGWSLGVPSHFAF